MARLVGGQVGELCGLPARSARRRTVLGMNGRVAVAEHKRPAVAAGEKAMSEPRRPLTSSGIETVRSPTRSS